MTSNTFLTALEVDAAAGRLSRMDDHDLGRALSGSYGKKRQEQALADIRLVVRFVDGYDRSTLGDDAA